MFLDLVNGDAVSCEGDFQASYSIRSHLIPISSRMFDKSEIFITLVLVASDMGVL